METTNIQNQQVPYRPGTPDRRRRKPDVWARVFRWLTLLIYPLLIIFFFIFFGVASADRSQAVAAQMGVQSPQGGASHMDLYTVLPLLLAGLLIGAIGMALSRVRARRRSDYNFRSQWNLVIVSVIGLVAFFMLR